MYAWVINFNMYDINMLIAFPRRPSETQGRPLVRGEIMMMIVHSCHILPFQPILWNKYFPPEPANTAKRSPTSISEWGRLWQVCSSMNSSNSSDNNSHTNSNNNSNDNSYTYMYIYIYIYVYTHMYMCIHMYVCLYIYIHVYI